MSGGSLHASYGYPSTVSSFRDDPITSSYECGTTGPNSTNPSSVGDIAGLCEIEDIDQEDNLDQQEAVVETNSNKSTTFVSANSSPVKKQTEV